MTTGVWPQVSADIIDSGEMPQAHASWTQGITQRGKPPRDTTAQTRRRIFQLALGWALAGSAVLRIAQLLGWT
ncbi:MAG: hypothetical protein JNK56_03480 [Myxococcales bacterium]|nr:hypothetical protein [Myxococcales bacterium]